MTNDCIIFYRLTTIYIYIVLILSKIVFYFKYITTLCNFIVLLIYMNKIQKSCISILQGEVNFYYYN